MNRENLNQWIDRDWKLRNLFEDMSIERAHSGRIFFNKEGGAVTRDEKLHAAAIQETESFSLGSIFIHNK